MRSVINRSRVFFLCSRYLIVSVAGVCLRSLWKLCRIEQAGYWGTFYALWFPLMFIVFSTLYAIGASRTMSDRPTDSARFFTGATSFCRYDDYTYLVFLWLCVLEFAAPYINNLPLWFAISYLATLMIKGGLFFGALYESLRSEETAALEKGRTGKFSENNCHCEESATKQSPELDEIASQSLAMTSPFRENLPVLPEKRDDPPPIALRWQMLFLIATLGIYVLISAYHIRRTSLTGDEPHYLLITHSLWHDYDTNLYNNYRTRDYQSFFWYELAPTWGDQVSATEVYSYRHNGGFPHTLIPGYVLGGQFGAVFQMNLLTAVLMLQVFLLAYDLFHSRPAAFFTWLCCAFSVPMIVFMGQLYPETLAALLTLTSIRQIQRLPAIHAVWSKPFWLRNLFIGAMLLLLVALKTRYLPLAATLGLVWFIYLLRRGMHIRHTLPLLVGSVLIFALLGGSIVLVDRFIFAGTFWERLKDQSFMSWILSGYNPLSGVLGLLFDQEYGLLTYAPIYALSLIGIGLLTREQLRAAWPLLGVVIINYLTISAWPLWHAAPTPPGRYLLPVLPLLSLFFAPFFLQRSSLRKGIVAGVTGIWSLLMAWFLTLTPAWRYNWADGVNNFLEALSVRLAVNVTKFAPSWIRPSPLTPYVTAGMIAVLIFFLIALRRQPKTEQDASPTPGFEFQLIGMIGIFLFLLVGGLALMKKFPPQVYEAEDRLDVRPHGGERVPPSPDPWQNQLYRRTWIYDGWKLAPEDFLELRPIFKHPDQARMEIVARSDEGESQDAPVVPLLLVLMNGKEIGRTPVLSKYWTVYPFSLVAEETRPQIEIKCEVKGQTGHAVIVDKIRFRPAEQQERR